MNRKDSPYVYIDTHAGAGLYDLNHPFAQKNQEYLHGITPLLNLADPPLVLDDFCQLIQPYQQQQHYIGSVMMASLLLRAQDTLHACELHPQDAILLKEHLKRKQRTIIHQQDGFKTLLSLLPPPQHRACVLIDPPYEDKDEYPRAIECLQKALKRFASGVYCLWYPILRTPSPQAEAFYPQLTTLALQASGLKVALIYEDPDRLGMFGTGMLILNAPYTLPDILEQARPALCAALAQKGAPIRFSLDNHIR